MYLSLARTAERSGAEIERLRRILADMPVTALSRYALAEIVLIRSAALLEGAIADIAYKIACGATFVSGQRDNLTVQCHSLQHARQMMLTENNTRTIAKSNLKWTKASSIADSVSSVIDSRGRFISACRRNGSHICEIFEVRHHVAHRNVSSRKKYTKWVRQQYGQDRKIQIGYFLLTQNLRPISNIDRYLTYIPIIINDIISGT